MVFLHEGQIKLNAFNFIKQILFESGFENLKNLSIVNCQHGNFIIEAFIKLQKAYSSEGRPILFTSKLETIEMNGTSLSGD